MSWPLGKNAGPFFYEMASLHTAKTAKSTLSSVLAVPNLMKSENQGRLSSVLAVPMVQLLEKRATVMEFLQAYNRSEGLIFQAELDLVDYELLYRFRENLTAGVHNGWYSFWTQTRKKALRTNSKGWYSRASSCRAREYSDLFEQYLGCSAKNTLFLWGISAVFLLSTLQ